MLIPSVCLVISIIIMIVAIMLAKPHWHNKSNWLGILLPGLLISSFFLFLPWYIADSSVDSIPTGFRAFSMTVHDSLKIVGGGQEIGDLEKVGDLVFPCEIFEDIYLILNYVYLIVGPVLTSGLLISLLGDWLDRILYHTGRRTNYHIFSQLNENSLQIAENLKDYRIVFCNTKNADKTMIAKARSIGALLLHSSCEAVELPLDLFRKKIIRFYLVDINEDKNLSSVLQLIEKHGKHKDRKIAINAFAESGTGIQVVESMDAEKKGNLAVRFIDMTAMLCDHLLMQYPLYDLPEGKRDISVMIVGCDKTGMRMLKTVAWCGIMEGYSLKIRVYDKNAKQIEDKFRIQCPEKMEKCDISFVEVDAETAEFEKAVMDSQKGSPDATYIVMAMGDDEKNMTVADRLFRLFRYRNDFGWTPQILVRIRSGVKSGVYFERNNQYLEDRKIRLFGRMDDIYGKNTLFYSNLERLAFAVHLCYFGLLNAEKSDQIRDDLKGYLLDENVAKRRREFMQNEYNRRSSMAAALHISAKLRSCGVLSSGAKELTDAHAVAFENLYKSADALPLMLAKNEHSRWNNFLRSEGFQTVPTEKLPLFYGPKNERDRDDLSKRHLCLVDWDKLPEVSDKFNEFVENYSREYNENEQDPKKWKKFKAKHFQDSDFDIVKNIPMIIRLANRLKETKLDEKLYL